MTDDASLSSRQLAIGPVAAAAAAGNMTRLSPALAAGLDTGLTVNELKEVLVQLYAYAGFPRSLNALGEFMKVLDDRRKRGIDDPAGKSPGPLPPPSAMLDVGTVNQTKLTGAPVKGALFEFAPAVDQYLKSHLFGDIFTRDNLDWRSRELATVAFLSSLDGVESQLLSHIRISLNVGLTTAQLKQYASALSDRGEMQAAQRLNGALEKLQTASK